MKLDIKEVLKNCDSSVARLNEIIEELEFRYGMKPFSNNENNEKYRWHDLRKEPKDLPKEDGEYWIHGVWNCGRIQEGGCEYIARSKRFKIPNSVIVVAWRMVEPFEEE